MLDAAKCTYAVIDSEGKMHGALPVNTKVTAKRKRGPHPYGSVRKYISGFIDKLQPGDVGKVPVDKYGKDYTLRNVSSFTISRWGKKSAIVSYSASNDIVEVLRVV